MSIKHTIEYVREEQSAHHEECKGCVGDEVDALCGMLPDCRVDGKYYIFLIKDIRDVSE